MSKNPRSQINFLDLRQKALDVGFEQLGWTPLSQPLTLEFYEKWIAKDYHASMDYLRQHLPVKKDPQLLNPQLKSALVLTHAYYPTQAPSPVNMPDKIRVARYAQNSDYHYWFKEKMQQLIQGLQVQYPDAIFLPFTDSGPILERDLGARAGLGWFGKNTCLIHPKKGSLFFIGEILTSLSAEEFDFSVDSNTAALGLVSPPESKSMPLAMSSSIPSKLKVAFEPLPDFCGKCTRCLEICPTQALESPRVLNANKCISFLTIESKTAPPLELRPQMGDWFFGCDLCQTVCPWNEKIFKFPAVENKLIREEKTSEEEIEFFRFILTASNKKLQKHFFGSPLLRATAFGLKRNTLIVIANKKITALKSEASSLQTDPKLGELAGWCMQCLG